MQKKVLQITMAIIFWEFLMFYQILVSPQVKRICLMSCGTTQDLGYKEIRKVMSKLHGIIA